MLSCAHNLHTHTHQINAKRELNEVINDVNRFENRYQVQSIALLFFNFFSSQLFISFLYRFETPLNVTGYLWLCALRRHNMKCKY
jgi:hypothetical protein